jgi:hypothetical protein
MKTETTGLTIKPEITEIIYITVRQKGKLTHEHHIIPLQNFWLEENDGRTAFMFPKVPKEIRDRLVRGKYDQMAISLTDDPKCEHGLDWSDMGCFRLVYKLVNPTITLHKKSGLKFLIDEKKKGSHWDRDITVADKVRWVN